MHQTLNPGMKGSRAQQRCRSQQSPHSTKPEEARRPRRSHPLPRCPKKRREQNDSLAKRAGSFRRCAFSLDLVPWTCLRQTSARGSSQKGALELQGPLYRLLSIAWTSGGVPKYVIFLRQYQTCLPKTLLQTLSFLVLSAKRGSEERGSGRVLRHLLSQCRVAFSASVRPSYIDIHMYL